MFTLAARDAAILAGLTRINAQAIEFDFVFDFFEDNVIGSDGLFVLKADSVDEFGDVIATKLAAEFDVPDPINVPEPGVVSMLGFGLLIFGFAMRRRSMSSSILVKQHDTHGGLSTAVSFLATRPFRRGSYALRLSMV